jgi:uncharacterized protein (DUF305 family)
VIEPAALQQEDARGQSAPTSRLLRWLPTFLALTALVAAVLWLWASRPPGDDSLEAGFARDMIVHHDQAVRMALLIREKTADPLIASLATDIILTQENQMGQMLGWLNIWGLPATGRQPPMAWMGHPTTGLMPGMATADELAHLESLTGKEADAEFLRLMIRHHQGGILMAEAAQGSRVPAVRDLAQAIVTAQQAEIAVMEEMLTRVAGDG